MNPENIVKHKKIYTNVKKYDSRPKDIIELPDTPINKKMSVEAHGSTDVKNVAKEKVYLKNIIYVDSNNICNNDVKIKIGQYFSEHNVQFYDIDYCYGNKSQDQLEESMNILCKDIMLCQKRYGAYIYDNNCNIPLNTLDDVYHHLGDVIRMIRNNAIDYIVAQDIPMMDLEDAQKLREKRIDIEMMRKGKLCKIVKLGSKTENHVNTHVRSIEEFNNLLKDYRHNRINTDSHYRADLIISFRCSVYRRENKKYIIDEEGNDVLNPKTDPYNMIISFVPYLKLVEMRYNRAWCIPMINTDDKVVALDKVLVL